MTINLDIKKSSNHPSDYKKRRCGMIANRQLSSRDQIDIGINNYRSLYDLQQ